MHLRANVDRDRRRQAVVAGIVVAAAHLVRCAAGGQLVGVLRLGELCNRLFVSVHEIEIIAPGRLPAELCDARCLDVQRDCRARRVGDRQRRRAPVGPHAILILHAHAHRVAAVRKIRGARPCLLRAVVRAAGKLPVQLHLVRLLLGGLPADGRARTRALDLDTRSRRRGNHNDLCRITPFSRNAVGVVGAHAPVFDAGCERPGRARPLPRSAGDGCKRRPCLPIRAFLQVCLALRCPG